MCGEPLLYCLSAESAARFRILGDAGSAGNRDDSAAHAAAGDLGAAATEKFGEAGMKEASLALRKREGDATVWRGAGRGLAAVL